MTDVVQVRDSPAAEPTGRVAPSALWSRERVARTVFWAVIAACVVYCLFIRLLGPRGLWLDEAQSVAIARLPVTGGHGITLFQALKQDGSPPLYYLLLHGWMAVFGEGERTVRALSFVLNLACIWPLLQLGKRLIGRRAAGVAVLAFITSPFAAYYASEARMYSLLMLLGLVGALALERTLRAPTWWSVTGLALSAAAVAMTHYWSLYPLLTLAIFLLIGLWRAAAPLRRGCRYALLGVLGGAVLCLPWLPTFLYQNEHTGTPWGQPATYAAVAHAFGQWSGGQSTAGRALLVVVCLLLTLAIFGRPVGRHQVMLDLNGHEPGRLLFLLSITTTALAVTIGKVVGNAWNDRYTALAFLPFLLCLALGTSRFTDQRLWAAAIGAVALFGSIAAGPTVTQQRTQAVRVAQLLAEHGRPGDVVLYCPDQLGPAVAQQIRAGRGGQGMKNLTIPLLAAPDRVDWVDYKARNQYGEALLPGLVTRTLAEAGTHRIWLVYNPSYLTYERLCPGLRLALAQRRSLAIWMDIKPDVLLENEELDSFTARRP